MSITISETGNSTYLNTDTTLKNFSNFEYTNSPYTLCDSLKKQVIIEAIVQEKHIESKYISIIDY